MRLLLATGVAILASFACGYFTFRPRPSGAPSRANLDVGTAAINTTASTAAASAGAVRPGKETYSDVLAAMGYHSDPLRQGSDLYSALEALDGAALRQLFKPPQLDSFKSLLRQMPRELRKALWAGLVSRWQRVDESAAMEWLESAKTCVADVDPDLHSIIEAFSSTRPDAVFALLKSYGPGEEQSDLTFQFVSTIAASQPDHAREWLAKFEDEQMQSAAARGYRRGLSKGDPSAAVALLETMSQSLMKDELSRWIINDATQQGLEATRAICRHYTDPTARYFILQQLAQVDPKAAAVLLDETNADPIEGTDKIIRQESFRRTALYLASFPGKDAVAEWLRSVPEEYRRSATMAAIEGLDPREGMPFAEALLAQMRAESATVDETWDPRKPALQAWLQKDARAALEWLDALPPGDQKDSLVARSLCTLAKEGQYQEVNRRWANLADQQLDAVAKTLAEAYAAQDPKQAADWATDVARQRGRLEPMQTAVEYWMLKDPAGAGSWVQALPEGSFRDTGAAACAHVAAMGNVNDAVAWVSQISDESKRIAAAEIVAKEWAVRDSPAATAWLKSLRTSQ